MTKRVISLRLPEDLAADVEMIARIGGTTMTGFITAAIAAHIEAVRADPEFQRRLRERIEADQKILDRLT